MSYSNQEIADLAEAAAEKAQQWADRGSQNAVMYASVAQAWASVAKTREVAAIFKPRADFRSTVDD